MRKPLVRTLGALATAVLQLGLASCSTRSPGVSSDEIVVFGFANGLETLNPLFAHLTQELEGVQLVFGPPLATSKLVTCTRLDADSWEIDLHPDVRFHDGTSAGAADLRASLLAEAGVEGTAQGLQIDATDAGGVRLRMPGRQAELARLLGSTYLAPAAALQGRAGETLRSWGSAQELPVGAGPFRVADWFPGRRLVLEANPTWFAGEPHLSRITFRFFKNVTGSEGPLLALQHGELDVLRVTRPVLDLVRGLDNLRVQPVPGERGAVYYAAFNLRRFPFERPAVRRALGLAIDRRVLVARAFGRGGPAPVASPFAPGGQALPASADTSAAARFGAEIPMSRRLLLADGFVADAAGVLALRGEPLRFTLAYPRGNLQRERLAYLLADAWSEIGVEAVPCAQSLAQMVRDAQLGAFDAALLAAVLRPESRELRARFHSASSAHDGNYFGYASRAVDSLLDRFALQEAANAGDCTAILERFDRLLEQDVPALFLARLDESHFLVSHRRLAGVVTSTGMEAPKDRWFVSP